MHKKSLIALEQATVLTANQRLTNHLVQQYTEEQLSLGKQAWTTPDILPLNAWLQRCWQGCVEDAIAAPMLVLNSDQQLVLWKKTIVGCTPRIAASFDLHSISKTAKQAWQLLNQWGLPLEHVAFSYGEDTSTFQEWCKTYLLACQSGHWLDTEQLMEKLISLLHSGRTISLPSKIIFVGFIDPTPLFQKFLDALAAQKCQIEQWMPQTTTTHVTQVALAHQEEELYGMANWASDLLKANGTVSIACVIPNLSDIRSQVEKVFLNVFSTQTTHPPFNISAGLPLSHYPIIHDALLFLQLNQNNVSFSDFSALLRSPFLGEAEQELSTRALLEAKIRRLKSFDLSLNQIITATTSCPILNQRLKRLLPCIQKRKTLLSARGWTALFSDQLALLGFPGERSLESIEYQSLERWYDLLTEFSQLDSILDPMNFNEAFRHLRHMASEKIFQPKVPQVPIQILGQLEAVGLNFDYLWIMGLHDGVWPPSPSPNPFLPISLQRKFAVPHATAEREQRFYTSLTEQFCRTANQVIISHPLYEEDRELRPSPLIKHIPLVPSLEFIKKENLSHEGISLEIFEDDYAPPLLEQETLGGSGLFKQQAACPFRAFAEYRLRATSLPTIEVGLNAGERGMIIHRALEFIWTTIKSHDALSHYPTADLQVLIQQATYDALMPYRKKQLLNSHFFEIEAERLRTLFSNCLDLEKTRAPFSVVSIERKSQVSIEKLTITTRVDRIDQLEEDGSQIIIDYKTGLSSMADWFGDRPDDPQLPLYCVASDHPIGGLVFAQIRANTLEFKGVTLTENAMPGVSPWEQLKHVLPWNEQLVQWRSVLEKLAEQFREGYAKVDPKDPTQTCQFCDLPILCRIKVSQNS